MKNSNILTLPKNTNYLLKFWVAHVKSIRYFQKGPKFRAEKRSVLQGDNDTTLLVAFPSTRKNLIEICVKLVNQTDKE